MRVRRSREIWESAVQGSNSLEREVVLLAAQPHLPPDVRCRLGEILSRDLDWEFISKAAVRHGVLQWLSRHVKTVGQGMVDNKTVRDLEIANLALAARQQVLVRNLAALLGALGSRDIPTIVFKGPVLSALAYGDSNERFSMDADVLVRRPQFNAAARILIEHGYEPSVELHRLDDYIDRRNAVAFLRHDGNIDLHWTLDDFPFQARLGDVWQHAAITEIAGVETKTLTPAQLFAFLCFHGAKHAWPKLCWIADLAGLMRADIALDLEAVVQASKRNRTDRIIALGLMLAHGLARAPLSSEVELFLSGERAAQGLARRASDFLFREASAKHVHLFRLAILQRPSDKIRFVAHRALRHFRSGRDSV